MTDLEALELIFGHDSEIEEDVSEDEDCLEVPERTSGRTVCRREELAAIRTVRDELVEQRVKLMSQWMSVWCHSEVAAHFRQYFQNVTNV